MLYLICALVFFTCFLLISTVWGGYYFILLAAARLLGRDTACGTPAPGEDAPMLTVVVAARNEEENIEERINDLLRQKYPEGKMEIIIASDGSTDRTAEIASGYADRGVRVLDFEVNRGRATVHNDAVLEARGEIVLFTDAETKFEEHFCEMIGAAFSDPLVGAAVGRIMYRNCEESGITYAATKYWDLETRLRCLESALGVMSFGTGACTAFRKDLYLPLSPTEDIDYAQTMNVVIQSAKVVFVPAAIAYDVIACRVRQSFRNRVRQTARGFNSMVSRMFKIEFLRRPHILAGVLFHKVLRQLTPFMLIALFLTNIPLIGASPLYAVFFILQCLFYLVAAGGFVFSRTGLVPGPVVFATNFCLLNAGRMVGVINAVLGRAREGY